MICGWAHMNDQLRIIRFEPAISVADLTELLHRAYAPLAAQGLRYLASHQDEAMTLERFTDRGAEGYIAAVGSRVAGTITLVPPSADKEVEWYRRPEVMSFEQFAVDPDLQGQGIGARLLDHAEARARALGATELACDTSEHAQELIGTYTRRGYRIVGRADWDITNYQSVVLSLRLADQE